MRELPCPPDGASRFAGALAREMPRVFRRRGGVIIPGRLPSPSPSPSPRSREKARLPPYQPRHQLPFKPHTNTFGKGLHISPLAKDFRPYTPRKVKEAMPESFFVYTGKTAPTRARPPGTKKATLHAWASFKAMKRIEKS